MRYTEVILLLALVGGTVYNVQNSLLRIFLIGLWIFPPLLFMFLSYRSSMIIKKSLFKELIYAFIIILLLLSSIIVNYETFKLSFEGASVEMLTAFLYIFSIFLLLFYSKVSNYRFDTQFIFYFFILVTFVLFIDASIRFIQNPGCFMNYSCRTESKILGIFINANITGQITVFLLIVSWLLDFKYKKIFQILLLAFLIMAQARSAWVSLVIVYVISYAILLRGYKKYLLFTFGFLGLLTLIIIDPLDLQNDGSGLSKLHFFMRTLEIIEEGSWGSIIFGFGASYGYIVDLIGINGWSPHASILKAFLYYGLFGVLSFLFILIHMVKLDKRMFLPILAFFIFGLAGAPIYWPTLSVALILLMIDTNIKQDRYLNSREVMNE